MSFLESLFGSFFGIGILVFLSKGWIETRIKESIKHEYDLRIEKVREAALIKAKAEIVAELFAEWISHPEDQRRLNQLSIEAFLWLPDDILKDLSNLLAHQQGAPSVRDIVIRVRAHLLGEANIDSHEVILFYQETIAKMRQRHMTELSDRNTLEAQRADLPDAVIPDELLAKHKASAAEPVID